MLRTLTRPLPLLTLSTSTLLLAATMTTSSTSPPSSSSLTANPTSWPTKPYHPRHKTWPYTPQDFTRLDSSPDPSFYSSPRMVTHIDDLAIASLRSYYSTVLPHSRGSRILDFCSSWISHYPPALEDAVTRGDVEVLGMGMNVAELDANPLFNSNSNSNSEGVGERRGRRRAVVVDLNANPDVAAALRSANLLPEGEMLDAATNVVSIDYLTQPVEVLKSLHTITKPGGTVHLTISNRCFPTKAIARWLRVDEEERLQMVGDFLWFAGWEGIEIVELSDGTVKGEDSQGKLGAEGGLQGLMSWMGMTGRRDPLWVVRAVKK